MDRIERLAFETFAHAYPHEAAEQDWPAFVKYTRKVAGDLTEEQIRECLKRTGGAKCQTR